MDATADARVDSDVRIDAHVDSDVRIDAHVDSDVRIDARMDSDVRIDSGSDARVADAMVFDDGGGGTVGGFDGGGSGSGGTTVLDIARRLALAECHDYLRCIPIEHERWLSEASCVRELTYLHRHADAPLWAAADAAGELDFNPTAFDQCLAHIRAAGCSQRNFRHYNECRRAFRGHAAVGEPCNFEFECEPGASCAGTARGDCPGECVPQARVGEACPAVDVSVPISDLGAPFVCADESHCEEGVCRAPRRAGEACHTGLLLDRECADGLSCDPGPGVTDGVGVCRPIATARTTPVDAPCDPQRGPYCASGLACTLVMPDELRGTGVQLCRPRSRRNARCWPASPSACPANQYCSGSTSHMSYVGLCHDFPQQGEHCNGASADRGCREGTTCFPIRGELACRYPGLQGAACTPPAAVSFYAPCLANPYSGCRAPVCGAVECEDVIGGNEAGVSVVTLVGLVPAAAAGPRR